MSDQIRARRRRVTAVLALAAATAAVSASSAAAAVTGSTLTATATPAAQSTKKPAGISMFVANDTTYDALSGPGNPSAAVTRTVLHFDDDITFNTRFPTCERSEIASLGTAAAIARCGAAQVGTGTGQTDGIFGAVPARITAFNGAPQAGKPTLLLHSEAAPPLSNVPIVLVGVLEPSAYGRSAPHGDYGMQLTIRPSKLVGGDQVITHFDVTIPKRTIRKANKKKNKPALYYVAARCRDANTTWDFYADGTFENRDGTTFELPAEHDQKCSPRKPKRKGG